jgi:elongation factor 1-alpha
LRIPISNLYSIKGVGTVLCGRIETGILKPNINLAFDCIDNSNNNKNTNFEVKTIERHHEKLERAIPGDNVGFNVRNVEVKLLTKGSVCGEANNDPPKTCKSFIA